MKNTRPRPGFGPRPIGLGESGRGATPAQQAVLRVLEAQAQPVTLAALCSATSLHINTVREHLDALVRDGLVQRTKAAPSGRGRPAWEYSAVPGATAADDHEYAGLAATLAAALHRHSPDPKRESVAAGRTWGSRLASGERDPVGASGSDRRRAVVALLARLRFTPVTGPRARTVRLTTCPLLATAQEYPDVVCSIHLGMVEGALQQWGDTAMSVDLRPFAEPGSCLLAFVPEPPTAPARRRSR